MDPFVLYTLILFGLAAIVLGIVIIVIKIKNKKK